MDAAQVRSQLLDLPLPFKRTGTAFDALISSQAAAESLYTVGSDASANVLSVDTAQNGWQSAWGEIFGLPRASNESNAEYQTRFLGTLANPVGTVAAIEMFGFLILGVTVSVSENAGSAGYTILISSSVSVSDVDSFIGFLDRIRPAGVPFTVARQTSSLTLTSYSYIGARGFAGAYLGYGTENYAFSIGASTPNLSPLAPNDYLLDPLLNGQISLGFVS